MFRAVSEAVQPGQAARGTGAAAAANGVRTSTAAIPEKLCELDYPAYWERRRVHQDGFRKFQGKVCFLSEALVGELVGLVEIDEAIWQVWLGAIEVAVLDVAAGRIWRIGAGKKPSRGPLT